MKNKAIVKWSKKEKDWLGYYPNINGKIVTGSFFTMIKKYEEFRSKDWQGKPTGFKNLRDWLSEGGFDPDTFQISVKVKKQMINL